MENETGLLDNVADNTFTHFNNRTTIPEWAKTTELVYLSAVAMFGVPGNLLILIVQWKNTNRSTTDYLVATMAMFELYCSGFNAPVGILRNTRILWPQIGSTFLCKFAYFSKGFATTGSSLMLAAIAVDRCIKTCCPLNTFYNVKQAKRMCVGLVITCAVVASPYMAIFTWNEEGTFCKHASTWILNASYYYGNCLNALYFSSFLVMFVCYFNISVALQRRHRRKIAGRKQQRKQMPSTPDGSTTENTVSPSPVTSNSDVTIAMTDTSSVPYVTNTDPELSTMSDSKLYAPSINQTNTATRPRTRAHIGKPLLMEGRNLKKLTVIMFTISLFYMLTWAVNWGTYIFGGEGIELGIYYMMYSLPLINCSTNAVMFFVMSSRFRENAKRLLCGRK